MSDLEPGSREGHVITWPWLALLILTFAVALIEAFLLLYEKGLTGKAYDLAFAVVPGLIGSALTLLAAVLLFRHNPFDKDRGTTSQLSRLSKGLSSLAESVSSLRSDGSQVRARSELPDLGALFANASEIDILAVSGHGLINQYRGELESAMCGGAVVRVILLDVTERDALDTWDRLTNPPMNDPEGDIISGVRQFEGLAKVQAPGSCELRLLDTLPPFSMIRTVGPDSGHAQAEFHSFRKPPKGRPNVLVTRHNDRRWFDYFTEQFQSMWEAKQE